MIIDMFKFKTTPFLSYYLTEQNQLIIDNDEREPGKGETFTRDIVSPWFNPKGVRNLWLGRTYPYTVKAQGRPEFNLILHASNYLTLFLIELLFRDRKEIMIEDFGCGDGRLFVYLQAMGFKNFSGWDDWSQIPYPIYGDMMRAIGLMTPANPQLNNADVNPVVVNNSHAPFVFISYGFDDREKTGLRNDIVNTHPDRDISNTELVTFYSGDVWENEFAPQMLPKRGFRFLCKDVDDLTVAWCREDKYEEFKGKLKDYE